MQSRSSEDIGDSGKQEWLPFLLSSLSPSPLSPPALAFLLSFPFYIVGRTETDSLNRVCIAEMRFINVNEKYSNKHIIVMSVETPGNSARMNKMRGSSLDGQFVLNIKHQRQHGRRTSRRQRVRKLSRERVTTVQGGLLHAEFSVRGKSLSLPLSLPCHFSLQLHTHLLCLWTQNPGTVLTIRTECRVQRISNTALCGSNVPHSPENTISLLYAKITPS